MNKVLPKFIKTPKLKFDMQAISDEKMAPSYFLPDKEIRYNLNSSELDTSD